MVSLRNAVIQDQLSQAEANEVASSFPPVPGESAFLPELRARYRRVSLNFIFLFIYFFIYFLISSIFSSCESAKEKNTKHRESRSLSSRRSHSPNSAQSGTQFRMPWLLQRLPAATRSILSAAPPAPA